MTQANAKDKKPTKSFELQVDIDAPIEVAWEALTQAQGIANWFSPEAAVTKPGLGGEVTAKWSEAMAMTMKVDAWEPGRHVRWLDESGFMGEGTSIALDMYLTTEKGKTHVRLVQSGFGVSGGWDDFFAGTKTGWTYFLYNLRVYLEKHVGRVRRMIAERIEATAPRDVVWRHILSAAAGLVAAGGGAIKAGDWVQLKLADPATVRAAAELVIEGYALGLRITELDDALLFIELEGGQDSFHVGYWLSVYDDRTAKELDTPAKRAFQRVHATLAKL